MNKIITLTLPNGKKIALDVDNIRFILEAQNNNYGCEVSYRHGTTWKVNESITEIINKINFINGK